MASVVDRAYILFVVELIKISPMIFTGVESMLSSHLYCTTCGAVHRPQAKFCIVCGRSLQGTLPPPLPTGESTSNTNTGMLVATHLLKHRYRILNQLGQGGMGAVYKAEDTQLGNRLMAVKEMSQSSLSPQELIEATNAFKNEALLLAGLMHPNLPRIYDHFTDGGRWYLVMDFIAGETLADHLDQVQEGSLRVDEVLDIGIQLCTVLDYLHNRQPPIIFRDLKPVNVMLTPDGHLYLIDFGIARHFKPGQAKDTEPLGTVGYAAPEQYGKVQTSASADIYSLGATLHQLLSGNDPSENPLQFAPLHQAGSSRLEALIMQMVETNKDKRPTSMTAVKQELQSIRMQRMAVQENPTQPMPVLSRTTLATSSSGKAQKASTKTKKQWLNEGKAHHHAGRYQEALATYEHTIQLDPDFPLVYNARGHVLYDLKRHSEALVAFERAIQLDPNFAPPYNGKGNVLFNLKRYTEALAAYDHALQLNPNLAHAYMGKGNALSQLKRYPEALVAFEHAIQLNPDLALAYNGKGNTLSHLQRHAEALTAYDRAIQLNLKLAQAYNGKGNSLSHLKRYAEALVAFDCAIQFAPNFAAAHHNRGLALTQLGKIKEAQQAFERARQLGYSG